jgi:hypothetical protein
VHPVYAWLRLYYLIMHDTPTFFAPLIGRSNGAGKQEVVGGGALGSRLGPVRPHDLVMGCRSKPPEQHHGVRGASPQRMCALGAV